MRVNETDVRQKVFRMARKLGYWPIPQTNAAICPNCKRPVLPPIGRPDILWHHPTMRGRVSECKVLRRDATSFPFSEITQDQRDWLDLWQADGGLGYIALGIIRPLGSRSTLVRLYLVDWADWRQVERLVQPIQNSIPYTARKGMCRELQEGNLDIVTLLKPWELVRNQGQWTLPSGHSAWPSEV